MLSFRFITGVAAAVLLSFCLCASAQTLPSGFTDTLVANVSAPTAIAFLPDGRMLVTTQGGTVRIVEGDTLLPTPALSLGSRVCTNSERGLLGIAVDPDFGSNAYVYVFYTHRNAGSCGTGSTTGPMNRVSRFTFSDANTIDPNSELVLLDNIWSFGGNHNAGDVQIGPDGLLYVSVGDGGTDYGGSGSAGANDAARERHHLLGKIVRITRDGAVPAGNPYTGAGTARCNNGATTPGQICQETWAWGLRNPFRMAFHPQSGDLYINDVGQGAWEEINRGQSGADYGWNVREGFCVNGSTSQCPPGNPTPAGLTEPIYAYRHSVTVPGTQTSGCRSITGGAFVPAGVWPAEFDGAYLFSDYVCGAIFSLKGTGGSATVADFVRGLGGGSAVHLRFGPFGGSQALYYTTYAGGGQVRRIAAPTAQNNPPSASASGSPLTGPAPLTVTFSAAGSGDPDAGDTLTYLWTFGDGTAQQTTTNLTISHTYMLGGSYTATLRVRDSRGALSGPATVQVAVGNLPPVLTMTSPAAGFQYAVGETILLLATATDPEQGVLPPGAFTWTVILHHDDHTHPFLGPLNGNSLSFEAPAPEDLMAATNSFLEVRVAATDAAGATVMVARNIQPKKVPVRLETVPGGLSLLVNQQSIVGGSTVISWENYALAVNAPRQTVGGVEYVFDRWEDGSAAANRTIVTPATATVYTARFREATNADQFTVVSGASFQQGAVARGAIVSGFGENLASAAASATSTPLPTVLDGVSVQVKDALGVARMAPLFLVSPRQINFLIPEGTALGEAQMEVLRQGGVLASGSVQVERASPAIFTANQSGSGVPAGDGVRVSASGQQSAVPILLCSGGATNCVALPIARWAGGEEFYLVLYGTGIRNRDVGDAVRVRIGGLEADVTYAGAQSQFAGLDQVNVRVPPTLQGRGVVELQLEVGGLVSNRVQLIFQ